MPSKDSWGMISWKRYKQLWFDFEQSRWTGLLVLLVPQRPFLGLLMVLWRRLAKQQLIQNDPATATRRLTQKDWQPQGLGTRRTSSEPGKEKRWPDESRPIKRKRKNYWDKNKTMKENNFVFYLNLNLLYYDNKHSLV